jgi:hypothetical protein
MQNLRTIITFLLAVVAPLIIITLVLREASTDNSILEALRDGVLKRAPIGRGSRQT